MSQPAPLAALRAGGKRALARALSTIEATPDDPATLELLDAAYHGARAHVLGITGPPGVGKSSLISRLVKAYRGERKTVGVIAVDPSSRRSGGALLGDRVRIDTDPEDQGVFVRSMAARDRLGGLAAMTTAAVVLMRAVHDLVIVETVGVGQSETEISEVGDTVLLCVQPGSGDSLQYMKAGIAEIPDIAVVNKADLGAPAKRTRADLTAALTTTGATAAQGWQVPVLAISARDDEGMAALLERIQAHWSYLRAGPLYARRQAQAAGWLEAAIREAYGRVGLERLRRLPRGMTFDGRESPFRALSRLGETLG